MLASLEMMTPIALHFFLLFREMTAKRDDLCHVGDPRLVECFGGVSALPCHDLAPVSLEIVKDPFDGVVGVPKVLFIELFDVRGSDQKNVIFLNGPNFLSE